MKFCLPALLIALVFTGCVDDVVDVSTGERSPHADVLLAGEFDLKAYRGKVVVLNFWATWCGPCRIEIPALVKLRKSFRPEEVAIIGVSTGERVPESRVQQLLKTFASEYDINYELYHDDDNSLFYEWAERASLMGALPSTLLFDASGQLQGKHLGVPRNRKTGKLDPFGVIGEEIQSIMDGT